MKTIKKEEVLNRLAKSIVTSNMVTSKGGKAANQFKLHYENGVVFKSYDSIIAIRLYDGTIILGSDYDYSKTTNKYRCAFLGEHMKETRQKLNDGTYLYCEEF